MSLILFLLSVAFLVTLTLFIYGLFLLAATIYSNRLQQMNPAERFEDAWLILTSELQRDIQYRHPTWDDSSIELEVTKARDKWFGIWFMSLEDKITALRAGVNPRDARKILRKFGREHLQVQAALRAQSNIGKANLT